MLSSRLVVLVVSCGCSLFAGSASLAFSFQHSSATTATSIAVKQRQHFVNDSSKISTSISTARRPSFVAAAATSDDEDEETTDQLVTKDSFMRDMLNRGTTTEATVLEEEQPEVYVQKKNGSKKQKNRKKNRQNIRDNRDSLPFRIDLQTPIVSANEKQHIVQNSIEKAFNQRAPPRPPSAVESQLMATKRSSTNSIPSTLYSVLDSSSSKQKKKKKRQQTNSTTTKDDSKLLLGEYALEKHTTTGDSIRIGDMQYKVVKHRCQYKYAGGGQFVMVRKILEVKEIGRYYVEEYLNKSIIL